jgi:hypothetical protein
LQVNVVDQDGLEIANSLVSLNLTEDTEVLTGTTLTLPVTEVSSGPAVHGGAENGYDVRTWPALNGTYQGSVLHRDDPRVELAADSVRDIVWEVAKGRLTVIDSRGRAVPGAATLMPYYGLVPSGTYVEIPVNDDALYPTLAGPYAGAYDVTIRLNHLDKASKLPPRPMDFGPFDLELLTGAAFSPAFVTIHGASYGVRIQPQAAFDLDHDGFATPLDADDGDATIHPGAPDLPGDLVDQDGDGVLACDPRWSWKRSGRVPHGGRRRGRRPLRRGPDRSGAAGRGPVACGAARAARW